MSYFLSSPPWFRNLTMFHKKESASEHCPWSSLKQSSKSGKMLRFDFIHEAIDI